MDPDRWAFERWDASVTLSPWKGVLLGAGTSNVPGTLHAAVANATVRFNERWSVTLLAMHDFENGREVFTRLSVRRTLHRWVLEVGIHTDRSRDDVGVSVAFLPLMAVPDAWR